MKYFTQKENFPFLSIFKDFQKEDNFNFYIQIGFLLSDIFIFPTLFFIRAYYGKFYNKSSLLPAIPTKYSWIIQEIPCVIISIYYISQNTSNLICIIYILPFLLHYIHRSLIYPFMIKSKVNYPLELTIMAFSFCVFNALMINRSSFNFCEYQYITCHFYIGIFVFFTGMAINIFHDYYMMKLRQNKDIYVFPKGYLYNYITSPNYLGEIIEWMGYAICTMNFSGFVFAMSTIANLLPRAIKYNKWYREKFKDEMGKLRLKAIIPYIL